jgi:hypothetical protein
MNYSIFVHCYTVNWYVQPDQHLHALTLCIGMPNLINMLLSSFCFCAANWNVNYLTFVHFYTVNWNVQPDQHLYASTLHIGMCNLVNICMLRHCTLECELLNIFGTSMLQIGVCSSSNISRAFCSSGFFPFFFSSLVPFFGFFLK